MGGAKKQYMEQLERGYGGVDGYVCANCFSDVGVQNFIEENLEASECDFCERISDTPIAAPLESVVGHIVNSIKFEWSPVEESGAPWDSEDKEFATEYVDFSDVLSEEGLDIESKALFDAITQCVDTVYWARPFGVVPEDEQLKFGWDRFCNLVTHEVRFVFYKVTQEVEEEWDEFDTYPPYMILEKIADKVKTLELTGVIPKGSEIVRVRISGTKQYNDIEDLGPPKPAMAKYPNRMNPAGITMFYGSDDVETALAETIGDRKDEGIASIGRFQVLDDLVVLDLTNFPKIPSIFEDEWRDERNALIFLHKFCKDFTRPIEKDDRVHIEYVPTQVVTEYFRHIFRLNGTKIDGIKYKSSRSDGGISYALFIGPDQCTETSKEQRGRWATTKKLKLLKEKISWKRLRIAVQVVDM